LLSASQIYDFRSKKQIINQHLSGNNVKLQNGLPKHYKNFALKMLINFSFIFAPFSQQTQLENGIEK